jgi:hypothetical protein
MKSFFSRRIMFGFFSLSAFLLLSTTLGFSQDPGKNADKKEKKATIVIKVKKDGDKTTVTDSTFDLSTPEGKKNFEKFMAEHEKNMKGMEKELQELEVSVNIPDLDSLGLDSVCKKVRIISSGSGHPRCYYINPGKAGDFSYDFEVPPPPPPPPGDFDFGQFGCDNYDGQMKVLRFNKQQSTLSDLIGDIPMERVKGYTIKDRKNGKRIIIDIEDAPLTEQRDHMIIIRDDGDNSGPGHSKKVEKKVIIRSGDSDR